MPNWQQLVEHYRNLPDEVLLHRALHEASGLTEEACGVLSDEIRRRGLPSEILEAVEAQNALLSDADVAALVSRVRAAPCPICGDSSQPLNAGVVAEAKSAIVFTIYEAVTVIACPNCLADTARGASWKSAALGWWSIIWGPIRTIQALLHNRRTLRQAEMEDASETLCEFVAAHPGTAIAIATGRWEKAV